MKTPCSSPTPLLSPATPAPPTSPSCGLGFATLALAGLLLGACGGDPKGSTAPDPRPGPGNASDTALDGALYLPARAFVTRYCADCHTSTGTHDLKEDAFGQTAVKLDTYAGWKEMEKAILSRLDPEAAAAADLPLMPHERAYRFPTPEERNLILAWLRKGSPNTPTGD